MTSITTDTFTMTRRLSPANVSTGIKEFFSACFDDHRLGDALEAHELDVVAPEDVEHAGARDPQHRAGEIPAQRERRHREMPPVPEPERHPGRRRAPDQRARALAEHRQPAEFDAEDDDQN